MAKHSTSYLSVRLGRYILRTMGHPEMGHFSKKRNIEKWGMVLKMGHPEMGHFSQKRSIEKWGMVLKKGASKNASFKNFFSK